MCWLLAFDMEMALSHVGVVISGGMSLELMSMGGLLSSGGSAFHWCSKADLKVDVKL